MLCERAPAEQVQLLELVLWATRGPSTACGADFQERGRGDFRAESAQLGRSRRNPSGLPRFEKGWSLDSENCRD